MLSDIQRMEEEIMDVLYENRTSSLSIDTSESLSSIIHLHTELEVVHVIKGTAVAYADKNHCILNEGDTFIAFPNQIHYYKNGESGEFLVLIFSADLIYGQSSLLLKNVPDTNMITAEQEPQLHDIFVNMLNKCEDYYDVKLNGYVNVMMGVILPHLKLSVSASQNQTALYSIIDYCSQNFSEDITLDSVAEKLHLSKYYISHLLNQKLGKNFREYVNRLRIAQACLLLRETDVKISDVSENVGFGTLRSFNRCFKQIMGISPVMYREQDINLTNLSSKLPTA